MPGKGTLVPSAGIALPPVLRARLEAALSTDLSAVRVGVDPRVAEMGARAVASGTNVLFAPGAYQPDTEDGQALIAHEVVHLTQQADGQVDANAAVGDVAINHDPALERAADDLGTRALRGEVVRTGGAAPQSGEAPYQGFFDVFDKIGDAVGEAVDTVTKKVKSVAKAVGETIAETVGKLVDPSLPEDSAGSFELQRLLESGDIVLIGAAYDALVAAAGARAEGQLVDVVTFTANGIDYSIEAAPEVTDAMIPAFSTRRDELAFLPVDPDWLEFALDFNREFKTVVSAFDLSAVRDDTRKTEVIAARLQYLFTERQRDLLTDYMETNLIPDRLFDGDETGRATAQQRIMIASKILAHGKYKPGSYIQDVHARMCYHWARIVWQYAGASTETSSRDLSGQFDIFGGAVLGGGTLSQLFGRSPDPELDPTAAHLAKNEDAFRDRNAPWSLVMSLQHGDWLYIYTENKSASGGHSVIFGGWLAPARLDPVAKKYTRAARIFDQPLLKTGGTEQVELLGEDLFVTSDGYKARPVTDIKRVDPDARPPDTVEELTPAYADGADRDRKPDNGKDDSPNGKFKRKLERKYGKVFDDVAFTWWMRGQNVARINQLAAQGRLTTGQVGLFFEANDSERQVDVISLYQRLYSLAHNSDVLEEKDARHTAAKDKEWIEKNGPYYTDKAWLEAQAVIKEGELAYTNLEADLLLDELDELAHKSELAHLAKARKTAAKAIKGKKGAEREAQLEEVEALDVAIAAAKGAAKANKAAIGTTRHELEAVKKQWKKLQRELAAIERQITKLEKEAPNVYETVNTPNSSGQIAGHKPNGWCEDMRGVPWDTFLDEPSGA